MESVPRRWWPAARARAAGSTRTDGVTSPVRVVRGTREIHPSPLDGDHQVTGSHVRAVFSPPAPVRTNPDRFADLPGRVPA